MKATLATMVLFCLVSSADSMIALGAPGESQETGSPFDQASRGAWPYIYASEMNLAQMAGEKRNFRRVLQALELTDGYPNRGFEWYYWHRRTHLADASLQDPKGWVAAVAFSPDGLRLVTGGPWKNAKVWDVKTGSKLREFKNHTSTVMSVGISPDSRLAVTGGLDRTVRVWSLETGEEQLCLEGHCYSIEAAAFSPNKHQFVTTSDGGEIKIWNLIPKPYRMELDVNVPNEQCLAFSPDGEKLAIGTSSGEIQIWETRTGKKVGAMIDRQHVWSLAFSPSGDRLVSGCTDGSLAIWDMTALKKLQALKGHSGFGALVAVSPDGLRIVSACSDGAAKVWDGAWDKILHSGSKL